MKEFFRKLCIVGNFSIAAFFLLASFNNCSSFPGTKEDKNQNVMVISSSPQGPSVNPRRPIESFKDFTKVLSVYQKEICSAIGIQ
jgi:hypothetical protein